MHILINVFLKNTVGFAAQQEISQHTPHSAQRCAPSSFIATSSLCLDVCHLLCNPPPSRTTSQNTVPVYHTTNFAIPHVIKVSLKLSNIMCTSHGLILPETEASQEKQGFETTPQTTNPTTLEIQIPVFKEHNLYTSQSTSPKHTLSPCPQHHIHTST